MKDEASLAQLRRRFHAGLLTTVLRTDAKGIPSNADRHSRQSVDIAIGILSYLGIEGVGERLAGQRAGSVFEDSCRDYLETALPLLSHLRPGHWIVEKGGGARSAITRYDQYEHLKAVEEASKANPQLAAALGVDYLIRPDVVVVRKPEKDEDINVGQMLVDDEYARLTPIRLANSTRLILHASISCKWTIRSDRAQNARSEGLNLVRNRKGRLPHIVVITGEPMPNRIASIALGTGDIDCVYHFALPELLNAVRDHDYVDAEELLLTMIEGKRLRDVADLPLDLVI